MRTKATFLKYPPPPPSLSTTKPELREAARNTPLPDFNFVRKLWDLRDQAMKQLDLGGDELLLKRALVRLHQLLNHLPKLSPDGPAEQRPFTCHVQATIVLVQLGHRFRGSFRGDFGGNFRDKVHFLQMVNQLEEHVLRAVLFQLGRPEVLKTLAEKHLCLDLELAATISLALIVAANEFDQDLHLKLLRQARPELKACDLHLFLLQAKCAGPRSTYIILEHLVKNWQQLETAEAEHSAESAVLTFGIGTVALPLGLLLLVKCSREPALVASAFLLLAATQQNQLHIEKALSVFQHSRSIREAQLPKLKLKYALGGDARAALDLIISDAEDLYEHHRLHGTFPSTALAKMTKRRCEPGWMLPPPPAIAPIISASAPKQPDWVPTLNEVLWQALQLPEAGLADHLRPSWSHLRPNRQRLILRLMTDLVMSVLHGNDTQRKLQLEMSALQVLLEFGADCLDMAQQLEMMLACSARPFLQARLAAAWIRLSPQRRLLLPRLLRLLPACRSRKAHTELFLKYLPSATKAALNNFLKRAVAAVPESAIKVINYYTAGVRGAQMFGVHHVVLWELAWRPAKGNETPKVFGYVEAITEQPDRPTPAKPSAHISILLDAPQLLDDMKLLEESKRVLPLLEKYEARRLLQVLASRAAPVDATADHLSTTFVDKTRALLQEWGFGSASIERAEESEQTPGGEQPKPVEDHQPPAKRSRSTKKSKRQLFQVEEVIGPEPEPAQLARDKESEQQLSGQKEVAKKRKVNTPTANKPQNAPAPEAPTPQQGAPSLEAPKPVVLQSKKRAVQNTISATKKDVPAGKKAKTASGPEVLMPQLDAPGPESPKPAMVQPKKRAATRSSTKADEPKVKKSKVVKDPEAPQPVLRRSRRQASLDATEAISRCYEAFDLRRRPPSWMISGRGAVPHPP